MGNAKTVGSIYEAFGTGNIPAILGTLSEDVEWEHDTADHGIPWVMPGRGTAHAAKFFETVNREIDITKFDVLAIVGDADVVFVHLRVAATVRATGKSLVDHEVHQWTFGPDGKVHRFRHVLDSHAHWLAAQK